MGSPQHPRRRSDEGKIAGNANGYRRLGIELLKSTLDLAAVDAKFKPRLESLIKPDSDIRFGWLELAESGTTIEQRTG